MSQRYDTQNPRPSNSMKDLNDNALAYDDFINSDADEAVDRFGKPFPTVRNQVALRIDELVGASQNAIESAEIATAAANNVLFLSHLYTSVAEAQAAIIAGVIPLNALFNVSVPTGATPPRLADQYKNSDGVAAPTGQTIVSGELVYSLLPQYRFSSSYVALFVDQAGKVPIWLDAGKFETAAVGDYTINYIFNNSSSFNALQSSVDALNAKLPEYNMQPSYYAAFVDKNGKVPLWFDGGVPDAVGVGPRLKDFILNYITENITLGTQLTYTDARTLWLWKANRSKFRNSVTSKLKIGHAGDSWAEKKAIPQSMAGKLYTEYQKAGEGWIQLNIDGDNQLNGIVFNRANWTVYDASTTSSAPTYGCALDGMAIYTSGTDATINISNLTATIINIYYYDGNGAFRYRVDGGGWTTVTGAGTNKPLKVVVSGLTNATHTVDIDTTVNAGTAAIYGFYASISNNGVEIQKFGNGGITAPQYAKVLPYIDYFAKELAPDVILMIIGTNDFRNSITISDFTNALSNWVDTYKTSLPNSAIILVAPPQSNATGAYPLSTYSAAMRKVATDKGIEFFDLYASFPATYAQSNAAGLWADSLHLNSNGAKFLVDEINKYFL